jgi:hypothetical protein
MARPILDLDTLLDPFWSADPAAAGAAWIRGGFKGHGSKKFFCIDIQDVRLFG